MRIAASTIDAQVARNAMRSVEERSELRTWIGNDPQAARATVSDETQIEAARRSVDRFERIRPLPTAARQPAAGDGAQRPVELSDEQETTLLILEKLFGIKGARARLEDMHLQVSSVSIEVTAAEAGDQRVGWGVSYDYSKEVAESETTAVSFSGTVQTADGTVIDLQLETLMQRSHQYREELHIRAGDAALIDPVVLDLRGDGIAFSGQSAAFDLDADGSVDDLAAFAADDLLLALDRNGNGSIDDGRELFGPSTGDGYGELRLLDEDGNGWLDEADSAFAELRLTALGGQQSISLADAGIGALYLGAASTAFTHKSADGLSDLAQVRASSLYLREDGRAGLSQQVDLVA